MTAQPRHAALSAARRIVTMLNEVEAGLRPARLLCPLFAVHLRSAIRRTRPHPGPVAGVHRLAVASMVDGAYEVVAVCRRGDRFGAVGMRLSRADNGAWLVTDVAHPTIRPGSRPPLSDPPGP
ncbi:MAG TPA: Rv3235 family protein [Euzebyales bacterium]|nr:Rv3235 family protein [Euzebyales bacterium]